MAGRTQGEFELQIDLLSRDQELQTRLEQAPEWYLVVCDESHRISAHYFGGEFKPTKLYQMGQRVGKHAPNGIDDATARVVLENSRTIKVDNPQMY